MQKLPYLTREFLNQRHRLSHQQIDELLNEKKSKEYTFEKYKQLFQVNELNTLSSAFSDAAIPFIPLKGPVLSFRLHNDASYRYSNDLDFLIARTDIEKAINILVKMGYQAYYFTWPTGLSKKRRLQKFTNQFLFVHHEKQLNIEIHWKLFAFEITNSNVLERVLKLNSHHLQFNERNFQVFTNELELLYLIIHGGLHAWFRLKWLIDVKDFIEKIPIDYEKFTQLVEQLNATRMVSLCNATLAIYFPECPLLPCKPVANTKKRLKFSISRIEDKNIDTPKNFLERIKFYRFLLGCFPGVRYKASVLAVIFYSKYLSIFEFKNSS